MELKKWLAALFAFTFTINVCLAIDLYANLPKVLLLATVVTMVVVLALMRPDRVVLRRVKKWYRLRVDGPAEE